MKSYNMANIFLSREPRDIETALLLEHAITHDIGNAVAYTDGNRIFINTDDNLFKILPAYNHDMLKWLLWHERYHKELRHHSRYYTWLKNNETSTDKIYQVLTKDEVNIIMDILVHDSLSKLFPELVPTAKANLAQMRDQNSLKYTFKTFTLEDMLKEYADHKCPDDPADSDDKDTSATEDTAEDDTNSSKDKKMHKETPPKEEEHEQEEGVKEEDEPEINDTTGHHNETDWSKLEKISTREFIDDEVGDLYVSQINMLKRKKIQLGRITETLNGLVTSTRTRTYSTPSRIHVGNDIIMKGRKPGKAKLYLCFDASGSMGRELELFKNIIQKAVPQALNQPCEWFTWEYGKGTFKDILGVHADNGYSDDGDRLIHLCYEAEQKGYSPIGVTDGGGQISWSKDELKKLQRTILVGPNKEWLNKAKEFNPRVQTLYINTDY